jgi:hypothetical protein
LRGAPITLPLAGLCLSTQHHHRPFQRVEVEADDITNLVDEQGILDNFQESCRWDCRPKARQIRDTAVWLDPTSAANDRVDRCVAPVGVVSNVVVMTRSWLIEQSVQPVDGESVTPLGQRRPGHVQHRGDLAVALPGSNSTRQHDPGP